ncbi:pilus assembly protein TadG-related protein [Streptomyces sp. NPDC001717]|uniref:pilus assembly protein TadG-related protein n=1 Tax=Streptomyces sp. NPDC001717 TaxID=3364604 RepID=UPI0036C47734
MDTCGRRGPDRGQALPIYVLVVAGLLFAALAFFVIGQASVTRSDAQGAADAAALAAGREARDRVLFKLDLAEVKPEDWKKIVDGEFFKAGEACAAAQAFALKNDATAECEPSLPRFTVTVETKRTVGDSVIPGTSDMHGTAKATALIEPKCRLGSAPTPGPTPTPSGGGGSPAPTPTTSTVNFQCGEELVKLDPLNPGSLTALTRKLFSVRLVG